VKAGAYQMEELVCPTCQVPVELRLNKHEPDVKKLFDYLLRTQLDWVFEQRGWNLVQCPKCQMFLLN